MCTPGAAFDSKVEPVDLAPALVDGDERVGDGAGLHGRQQVHHVGALVAEVELERAGGGIDVDHAAVGTVVDHARVELGPGLPEERPLGGDVLVGVEDHHLGARLGLAEVCRGETGALVRAGRAAVGRLGDRDHEHAAVRHRLEPPAQLVGLRASLPGVQRARARRLVAQRRQRFPREVDSRGDDGAVVGDRPARGEPHFAPRGIDRHGAVMDHPHAVPLEAGVGHGDVLQAPEAGHHEVRHRARDERRVRLDEDHLE